MVIVSGYIVDSTPLLMYKLRAASIFPKKRMLELVAVVLLFAIVSPVSTSMITTFILLFTCHC